MGVQKYKGAVNNFLQGQACYAPVRELVYVSLGWAAVYNVRLVIKVVAVECFKVVTCISHLYLPGQLFALESWLGIVNQYLMPFCELLLLAKMSLPCLYAIFPQVQKWRDVKRTWYLK